MGSNEYALILEAWLRASQVLLISKRQLFNGQKQHISISLVHQIVVGHKLYPESMVLVTLVLNIK